MKIKIDSQCVECGDIEKWEEEGEEIPEMTFHICSKCRSTNKEYCLKDSDEILDIILEKAKKILEEKELKNSLH